jgi:hypothetical protein
MFVLQVLLGEFKLNGVFHTPQLFSNTEMRPEQPLSSIPKFSLNIN